jgi:hypothetical protein
VLVFLCLEFRLLIQSGIILTLANLATCNLGNLPGPKPDNEENSSLPAKPGKSPLLPIFKPKNRQIYPCGRITSAQRLYAACGEKQYFKAKVAELEWVWKKRGE